MMHIFLLRRRANQNDPRARPVPTRGALRDRHERWARDAMDALCCETNSTERTAKSCGPGAPMQVPRAMRLRIVADVTTLPASHGTVTTKPVSPGRARIS